jgi:tetratricopeptide (TPR) repeat protein
MIEVLEQLVADGKYREAIKLAEQILSDGVETPHRLLQVQCAIVIARCWLREYEAACAAGEAALSLARELGDWESFGKVALFVSTANSRLGLHEVAIRYTYEYLAHLDECGPSQEAYAWFNLGNYFLNLGRAADATKAFTRALEVNKRRRDHRNAHGARHALIQACLEAHDYGPIPRLIAQSAAYLRRHPQGQMVQDSWVYHMRLRAEYALATGRPHRAMAVALAGLQRAEDTPYHLSMFHILLTKVAESQNRPVEAVGHAIAARTYARLSGRADLEAEASEILYQVSGAHPEVLGSIDKYYLAK